MLEVGKVLLVILIFGIVLTPMYFFSRYLGRATKHIRGRNIFVLEVARIFEPEFYVNLGKSLIAFAVMATMFSLIMFSGS